MSCRKKGPHYCEPRADRVVEFFPGLLVHVKGAHARKAFRLAPWQEHDIMRPVFGEVEWSAEWERYVRRFRVAGICLGRKNGKSAQLSGTAIYLVAGDDEEGAEVYGAAKDTKQAGKVFEPAQRMVQLSPALRKRLKYNKNARRIYDERTASYYETITSDALGELGHNPHGFILDEVLSQPDDSLWNSLRSAAGARTQPLFLCITTETNQPESFGAEFIDELERIQEDPERAPHIFAYVRKLPVLADGIERLHQLFPDHPDLPVSTDPFDEANWKWPNPGLDDFLSRQALRDEALEALNDPSKENAFRQFRANQRTSQSSRWMPMHLYAACTGEPWPTPEWRRDDLAGRMCYAGLDLAARYDLTSWCLLFPGEPVQLLWRFWLPEAVVPDLDRVTGGQASVWIRDGWLTVTEGEVTDFDRVYDDVAADCGFFTVRDCSFDPWSGDPAVQAIQKRTGLEMEPVPQNYAGLSAAMHELMSLTKSEAWEHHGNPVARWCFDSVEVRHPSDNPDLIKPVKPQRSRGSARIDGVVTACLATVGYLRHLAVPDYDVLESVR